MSSEEAKPGPQHPYHQSCCNAGRDWWGRCCAAKHWPMPAGNKCEHRGWTIWAPTLGLNTDVTNLILRESELSEGGVHLQHLSQCLQKRQSDDQNAQIFLPKNLRKQQALAPVVPIRLSPRLIMVMVVLCCKASAKASDPHHLSPRTWPHLERRSIRNQKSPFEEANSGPQHRCHQFDFPWGRELWVWCSPSASQQMPAGKSSLTLKMQRVF